VLPAPPRPCWSEVFLSLAPWLLLDLTGLNWGRVEILEKTQDRQTNRKLETGVLYARLEMHNSQCFSSPDSLRPYSLQFFKTLLQTSFLRLALSHVCSQLSFSLIALKVFCPRLALSPLSLALLKLWCSNLQTAAPTTCICITPKALVLRLALRTVPWSLWLSFSFSFPKGYV
jgi:hypothetical protein